MPFSQEVRDPNNPNSETILLDERRAAVQARLPLMLVRDLVGRLWGEAHRPTIVVRNDPETSAWIQAFVRDTSFWLTLIESSWSGASGSTCIVLRVLGDSGEIDDPDTGTIVRSPIGAGRFFAEVWPTKECQPVFKRSRPSELASLERIQIVSADTLRAEGYNVEALERKWQDAKFGRSVTGRARNQSRGSALTSPTWALRMLLDTKAETWYEPIPMWLYNSSDFQRSEWTQDSNRTFNHELGEVPARWARPIPFPASSYPDGLCAFEPVIDFQFRIDRTLSQIGRAFDYVGDPQLAIERGDADARGEFGQTDGAENAGADAVIDGKASYVEISGEGLRVAIDQYVKALMRLGREVGGGSRIDEEQSMGSVSGTAMRLLNSALDTLVGILRITLGERLMVDLLRLAMRMALKVNVELPMLKAIAKQSEIDGEISPDPQAMIDCQWPDAYAPTGQDLLFQVQAIETAAADTDGPPLMSFATAVSSVASLFGTQDAKQEEADIIGEVQLRQSLQPVDPAAANDPRDAGKGPNSHAAPASKN